MEADIRKKRNSGEFAERIKKVYKKTKVILRKA